MIFLSKDGNDRYVNDFAKGCKAKPVSTKDFVYESSNEPIVLRGIMKHKIMKQCWHDQRTFYYIDTGYFGNEKTKENPNGWKFWHRIVKNDLQHNQVIERPDDRFRKFNKVIHPWKKGKKILIAAPDDKPCKFYNVDREKWLKETVFTLRKYTDRPIEVRERNKDRKHRIQNTLEQALNDDVFALVTFNSVAATESVFHGVPVFTLAPNAAAPMGKQDLSEIESPYYPTNDERYAWACHLAYGQFHTSELQDGSAKNKLEKWF